MLKTFETTSNFSTNLSNEHFSEEDLGFSEENLLKKVDNELAFPAFHYYWMLPFLVSKRPW
jgi:hypothetical protein